MINTVALHKLAKLQHSRMLLIYIIACAVMGMFSVLPVIMMGIVAGNKAIGGQTAAMYFGFARFFGFVAALLLGTTLWRSDEKDGTLVTFLARPLSRIELLLGKTLGCVYALLFYLAAVVVFYLVVHLAFFRFGLPLSSLLYLIQELTSYLVCFAVGAFLTSFFKPLLAATAVIGWFILGLLAKLFLTFPPDWSQLVGKILRFVSLDTDIGYGIRELLTADIPTIMPLFKGIGYNLLWTIMLLSAAIILFSTREFRGRRS